MSISKEDALAVISSAMRLGVDPGALAGLMELESGMDPNIIGGADDNYRGLIQFGPGARQEVELPDGPMTISQQMPYVEKYFAQRGFTPGEHDTTALYRTVLVGNPYESGTDSFGTNSDSAAKRMMPGGDLYQRGKAKLEAGLGQSLGDMTISSAQSAPPPVEDRGLRMAGQVTGDEGPLAVAVKNISRLFGR